MGVVAKSRELVKRIVEDSFPELSKLEITVKGSDLLTGTQIRTYGKKHVMQIEPEIISAPEDALIGYLVYELCQVSALRSTSPWTRWAHILGWNLGDIYQRDDSDLSKLGKGVNRTWHKFWSVFPEEIYEEAEELIFEKGFGKQYLAFAEYCAENEYKLRTGYNLTVEEINERVSTPLE